MFELARKDKSRKPVKTAAQEAPERVVMAIQDRRGAILDAIDSARARVTLSMFRCRDFKVMDRLAEALKRGVQVDLLLTRRAKGWESKIRDLGLYLEGMGARVNRFAFPKMKYHAKYVVIDHRLAIVATLNLTPKCFEETADFLLLTQDSRLISGLLALFDHDVHSPDQPLPAGLSERLIIGPDGARAQFSALLQSARDSIRILDHRVTDPEMLNVLRAKRKQGLKIEVYGKGAIEGYRSHGKVMLIDEARAALGSISLSPPSLDTRREVAAITDEPGCVGQIRQFLKKARPSDWEALAAKPDPGDDEEDEANGEDS